jgi:hypothetical protein
VANVSRWHGRSIGIVKFVETSLAFVESLTYNSDIATNKGRNMTMQAEVKVLGGLSITVEFTACAAEPDVGLMSDYFEDWSIVEIAGRTLRKKESAEWLYKRMTKKDEAAIETAIYQAMEDARNDYYED